ncbi:hypothetical protein PHSY_001629 [Pseudozyma hubeiensis SY62]|uniref:Aminoglycoside phosphotransferase domain-containing protein n=1 Tax=Pseudozyma hubeiensis (strain SY62) TaxID=1305764 RepID=R9P7H4_PSEHS|nr:hypothetical protein PHSY_001629 [Pseudozyma hubeiensis SY62]GAC94060.1 hypothetical protein PHSY_001629 [Pseudozyma hubeiensis SY62]
MLTRNFLPTTSSRRTDGKIFHDITVAGKACVLKRILAREEFQVDELIHRVFAHTDLANRMRNEKADIDFVRRNTTFPVPEVLFYLDESDGVYLGSERVQGIRMDKIEDEQAKATAIEQLNSFTRELAKLRSPTIRGFPRVPCFPLAIKKNRPRTVTQQWARNDQEGYPLCHGDLHEGNVIVDPDTMRAKAVLNWDHCGFYPAEVDAPRCQKGRRWVVQPDGTCNDHYEEYERAANQKLADLLIFNVE